MGIGELPISFSNSLLYINRDVEPFQNVGHGNADAITRHRFDLAVVLVKFLLEIIDAADCLIQCFLYHFGVGFAALQQVNYLLDFVLYLIYQKIRVIFVLVHFVQ